MFDIFKYLFGKQESEPGKTAIRAQAYEIVSEVYVRDLAFNMMVNKIANAIAKCEVKTYRKKKQVKSDDWYLFNIQPNVNQNATQFWNKLIYKMYNDGEALVLPINGQLFIADSFYYDNTQAFNEHTFRSIYINGLALDRTYSQHEAFYFRQSNKKIRELVDGICLLYGKLISIAYASYSATNGNKGILKIDTFAEQQDDFESAMSELLNEDFRTFFNSANAVLPLYKGYEYEPIAKTGSQTDTRDIRSLTDDIIELTAGAFGMSKQLATGEVADTSKAVEDFLTFTIEPLCELIADEINRKNYAKTECINGTFIRFDTTKIKHIDIFDVSSAVDKLVACGAQSLNEIRVRLGEDEIEEDWASKHFMTKNYARVQDVLEEMKGGDSDGKENDADEDVS